MKRLGRLTLSDCIAFQIRIDAPFAWSVVSEEYADSEETQVFCNVASLKNVPYPFV